MENVYMSESFINEMDEIISYLNGESGSSTDNTAIVPQYHNAEDTSNESYPENWCVSQEKQHGQEPPTETNPMESSFDSNIAVMENMDVDFEQSFVDTAISGPETNRKEYIANIENARKAREEVMGIVIPVNIVNLLQCKDNESNENDERQQTPKKRRNRDKLPTSHPRVCSRFKEINLFYSEYSEFFSELEQNPCSKCESGIIQVKHRTHFFTKN